MKLVIIQNALVNPSKAVMPSPYATPNSRPVDGRTGDDEGPCVPNSGPRLRIGRQLLGFPQRIRGGNVPVEKRRRQRWGARKSILVMTTSTSGLTPGSGQCFKPKVYFLLSRSEQKRIPPIAAISHVEYGQSRCRLNLILWTRTAANLPTSGKLALNRPFNSGGRRGDR